MTKYYGLENEQILADVDCGKVVLDVGAGKNAFSKATIAIDYFHRNYDDIFFYQQDICLNFLPFPDKLINFVHCRQTIEDLANPEFALREMLRVGRAGYFECPSIVQELSRSVDADNQVWRGHHHHRSFICFEDNTVIIIPKYPAIEHLTFPAFDKYLEDEKYWNDYMLWEGSFVIKNMRLNVDFQINDRSYRDLIIKYAEQYIEKKHSLASSS